MVIGANTYAGAMVAHDTSAPAPEPGVFGVGERELIGAAFVEARKSRGLSQRELERASKVPQGKISRIERGATYPTTKELAQLANALQLRLHLVVLDDGN